MQATAVHLNFRYSEQDYVRAMRTHYRSKLRLPLDIGVIVITTAIGGYLWRSGDSSWFTFTLLLLASLFALMLVTAFLVIPSFVFRREAKFRDDYDLSFSPESIHFRTVHIDSQLEWNLYSQALIDSHSYILYYGAGSITVIPKSALKSAHQRESFEQLLSQHIPKIVRK
jgi:hypothetical protein